MRAAADVETPAEPAARRANPEDASDTPHDAVRGQVCARAQQALRLLAWVQGGLGTKRHINGNARRACRRRASFALVHRPTGDTSGAADRQEPQDRTELGARSSPAQGAEDPLGAGRRRASCRRAHLALSGEGPVMATSAALRATRGEAAVIAGRSGKDARHQTWRGRRAASR